MTRTERLYALVEYLRGRRTRNVNVAHLAERFAVSERTIFRDLASLRGEYVPIEAEPGPGGGLRLAREYSMPALNFTLNEGAALWISVVVAMRHHRLPWQSTLQSVLDKVLGAMSAEEQRRLWLLVQRLVVIEAAAPALVAEAGEIDPAVFESCRRAIVEGRRLSFAYVDRHGTRSEREVEPHGLLVSEPLWYVLARDVGRDAPRSFRLDRIQAAQLREGPRFDPADPRPLFPELAAMEAAEGRAAPTRAPRRPT